MLFFLKNSETKYSIKYIVKIASGIVMPISLKIKLLNIADVYCKIEVAPNTGFNVTTPEKILNSFRIFIYGK